MENIEGEIVKTGDTGIHFNDKEAINRIRQLIQHYNELIKDRSNFIDKTQEDIKKSMEIFHAIKDVLTELRKIEGFEEKRIEEAFQNYLEIVEKYKEIAIINYEDSLISDFDEFINSYDEKRVPEDGFRKPTDEEILKRMPATDISEQSQREYKKLKDNMYLSNRIDSFINSVNNIIDLFETQLILNQKESETKNSSTNELMTITNKSWIKTFLSGIINKLKAIFGVGTKVVATVDYKEVTGQGESLISKFRESLSIDENVMNLFKNRSKNDFTFLTQEQCFKGEMLDILKERGRTAAITDFSILLGVYYSHYHVGNDSSLEGRRGDYWIKSDDGYNDAHEVNVFESKDYQRVDSRDVGARPALPFSSIDKIPTNGESAKRARDGILEVEYGYYPQKAAPRDMQERLERAYLSRSISKTRNSYTTDSRRCLAYDEKFAPKQHEEYEYNGKRYVRVEANSRR